MVARAVTKKITDLPLYSLNTNQGNILYNEGGVSYQYPMSGIVKNSFTFTVGGTLRSNTDRISDGTYLYYWTGAYPVTVTPGSNISTLGGIGVGKWAPDTVVILQDALAQNTGWLLLGSPDNIDGLSALNVANGSRLLVKGAYAPNDGGSSWWKFMGGDHSDMVTNYPKLCRAPNIDSSGASGVWVKVMDGDLMAHHYGLGISQDEVVNGNILRNLTAYTSNTSGTITEGYGKKIYVCGDVIWIDYINITQSSVHIEGVKGATANQFGGKGTVFMFRDGTYSQPALTVSGGFTTNPSTLKDTVTSRVTGWKLQNITLVSEQFFINAGSTPSAFTSRSSRRGLSINYVGGHGGIDNLTVIGFASNYFNEVWDSSFYDFRIMYCGSETGEPGLYIGSNASDNSNNLNFYQFHMEFCPYAFYGSYMRNVHFIGGKFEAERSTDSTYNAIKLNIAAWEVKFIGVMFVTGHTTTSYYFWNEGTDVGFTDCEWEARNPNATDKYPGIRWYRGNTAIGSRNFHTGSIFKKPLASNGSDLYPIVLGNSETWTGGGVVSDTTVTYAGGTISVANSGLIALNYGSVVDAITVQPNANAKTGGALFNLLGTGGQISGISVPEGQPYFDFCKGLLSNRVQSNYAFKTSNGAAVPNIMGYDYVVLGAADSSSSISITGFTATVGKTFSVRLGQGSVTIVNNSASIITKTGANITLAGNTIYQFTCINSNGVCIQI